MYQSRGRRCCAWMLAVSVCLRLCMFLGLDARAAAFLSQAAKQTEFARFMLFLETGQAVDVEPEKPEPRLWVLQVEPPEVPQPQEPAELPQPPATVTAASASEITVAGGCSYAYDKAALLARPSTLDFSGDDPKILIVHTHGSEAYTPEAGDAYPALSGYRTLDPSHSVIRVGQVLAQTLQDAGIFVIHDTAINDYPSYNDSYYTTLQRIENWKARYPGLQMVLDIHRDAVEQDGKAVALSATADGESCARLMLVVGTDEGGLTHPNWQENLANALKLQAVLQGTYPGLCRSIDLRTERFNQHATPGSVLVEVGTNGNTLTQALRSAELLGESIARMIAVTQRTGGTLQ